MNNSDPQTSDPYTNSMLSERTEPGTVNPACENLVDDSCENIIDNDNIEVSFMGSNADERLVDENVGDDTYSVESESEIFITERRLELRNQDSPRRRLSETSDSSALTDDDSLGAYYSDNEHYIDESIMWASFSPYVNWACPEVGANMRSIVCICVFPLFKVNGETFWRKVVAALVCETF